MSSLPVFQIDGEIMPGLAARFSTFAAGQPGPVALHVNSPGGLATEGAALFAAIEAHGQVTASVFGIAASAASLAVVAAKKVQIHTGALMMIHEPAAFVGGTSAELMTAAAVLQKLNDVYAGCYARATGNSVARVKRWMAEETWMTAEEAVALHFADEILSGETSANAFAAFDYTKFRAAPATLLALTRQKGWAPPVPGSSKEQSNA